MCLPEREFFSVIISYLNDGFDRKGAIVYNLPISHAGHQVVGGYWRISLISI
jgi:hypothetical protein